MIWRLWINNICNGFFFAIRLWLDFVLFVKYQYRISNVESCIVSIRYPDLVFSFFLQFELENKKIDFMWQIYTSISESNMLYLQIFHDKTNSCTTIYVVRCCLFVVHIALSVCVCVCVSFSIGILNSIRQYC